MIVVFQIMYLSVYLTQVIILLRYMVRLEKLHKKRFLCKVRVTKVNTYVMKVTLLV